MAVLFAVLPLAAPGAAGAAGSNLNCAQLNFGALKKETNLEAPQLLAACGRVGGGSTSARVLAASPSNPLNVAGPSLGIADVDTIPSGDTAAKNSQSGAAVAIHGPDVVVNYNDSRDSASTIFSGISVSHDGGASFTRLGPSSPLTGHGGNFGDPLAVYDNKLGEFLVGDLATGCGGQGIGLWTSTNGDAWSPGACAANVSSGNGDRPAMAVDNTPTSPFYGRLYVTYNDFSVAGGAPRITHSDDGTTWSAPVTLNAGFLRNASVTAGPDGTVFVAVLNEGGGGCCTATEQNSMFRSTDGGVTWSSPAQALIPGTFTIPGDSVCSTNAYFPKITPLWRETGWGENAATTGGTVLYDYAAHGAGADPSDIFVVRSTDNGLTWGAPVKLNTDATTRAQWMPSLVATASGAVVATWYDRRNTSTNDYERFARVSADGGATWDGDQAISDVTIPQAANDASFNACYGGDANYPGVSGNAVLDAWTDGRVQISGTPQEDVFVDRLGAIGPSAATQAATDLGVHTATLNGLANDNAKAGSAHFEYGTTNAYGQTTPDVILGIVAGGQPVSQAIGGLTPNTTYHFRLDAQNPDGTDSGIDRSFTTPALAHHRITVVKSGLGSGSIAAADGQISCGPTCTHVYQDEDQVTLTAAPDAGSIFAGWFGGGCPATGPCTFQVSSDQTVAAIFKPLTAFKFGKPTLNKKKGTAVLPVDVPDSGGIALAGKGIKPITKRAVSKHVARAGTVNLKLTPTRKAKKRLKKRGKAKVRADVTFTVTGGDPLAQTKKLKLVRRRARSGH